MILYIGQYRGGQDEWSTAAKHYLHALERTGLEVASQPIYMNKHYQPDGAIWQTEKQLPNKPKIVIQNVIPDYFEYMPGYNIGIIFTETKNLARNPWIYKINLLDELWVNTESEKEVLEQGGVNIKISVIPIPIDTDYLEGNLDNIDSLNIPELIDEFVFYFIGDYVDRNNIDTIIQAYNQEFTCHDNVKLVIKTSIPGQVAETAQQTIVNALKRVKQNMRIFLNPKLYPNEIIITQPLTNDQTLSLHKTCHCFVTASRGESFSIPTIYAAYMNKRIICTDGIHTHSALPHKADYVSSIEVPVYTESPPIKTLYTSRETWMEPSLLDLRRAMREAYNNPREQSHSLDTQASEYVINNFSYQAIADKIKENLSWAL